SSRSRPAVPPARRPCTFVCLACRGLLLRAGAKHRRLPVALPGGPAITCRAAQVKTRRDSMQNMANGPRQPAVRQEMPKPPGCKPWASSRPPPTQSSADAFFADAVAQVLQPGLEGLGRGLAGARRGRRLPALTHLLAQPLHRGESLAHAPFALEALDLLLHLVAQPLQPRPLTG